MIAYSCDLCGKSCNDHTFVLPIAATFIGTEPCDLIPVNVNLCKGCISEMYKVIAARTSKERIVGLNKLALDIKMGR